MQFSKFYLFRTLGCKANFYDSQLIEAELQKRGWLPVPQKGPSPEVALCIINSCTVTDEADKQTRKMAARLARDYPGAKVVVTGCAAEVDPERLTRSKGIHYVVGNRDKPGLVDLVLGALEEGEAGVLDSKTESTAAILGVAEGYEEMASRHPMDREWPSTEAAFRVPSPNQAGENNRTRAFLKIQDGCNSFCTYCIIPYARGPSRSLKDEEIILQIQALCQQGIREVVLTGINIGDYATDWNDDTANSKALVSLFKRIFAESTLERLRVSSLDPTEISPEMVKLMENEPRFCPHFHVSLQSPHSGILRLMKRRYGFEHVRECLERIIQTRVSAGEIFIGMDLIAGFPGESEQDFSSTLQTLSSLPWSRLHVFPYSERAGTPACRLSGAVPPAERHRRARLLTELSLNRLKEFYARSLAHHRTVPMHNILIESIVRSGGREYWAGYTPNYLHVLIPSGQATRNLRNQLVSAYASELLVNVSAGDVSMAARMVSDTTVT